MDTLESGPTAFIVSYEGRRQCGVIEISQVSKWQYVVSIPGPLDRKSDPLPHNHSASLKNKHKLDASNRWLDPMANTVTSRDTYDRNKGRRTSVRAVNDLKKSKAGDRNIRRLCSSTIECMKHVRVFATRVCFGFEIMLECLVCIFLF